MLPRHLSQVLCLWCPWYLSCLSLVFIRCSSSSANSELPFYAPCELENLETSQAYVVPRIEIIKNELEAPARYLLVNLNKNYVDFVFDEKGTFCWHSSSGSHTILDRLDSTKKAEYLATGDFLSVTKEYINQSGGKARAYNRSQIIQTDWAGNTKRSHQVPQGIHHAVLSLEGTESSPWIVTSNSHTGTKDESGAGDEEDSLILLHEDLSQEELPLGKLLDKDRKRSIINDNPNDWAHINSIDYDVSNGALLLSLRHQSAIVKLIPKNSQRKLAEYELAWILAVNEGWRSDLQSKVLQMGKSFKRGIDDFSYGSHSVSFLPSADHKIRILVFDNGLYRGYYPPEDFDTPQAQGFSRVVEYAIDEGTMTVELLWEYQHPSYAGNLTRGSVERFANGHTLILWPDNGLIQKAILQEIDANKNTVFEAHIINYDKNNQSEIPASLFRANRVVWNP